MSFAGMRSRASLNNSQIYWHTLILFMKTMSLVSLPKLMANDLGLWRMFYFETGAGHTGELQLQHIRSPFLAVVCSQMAFNCHVAPCPWKHYVAISIHLQLWVLNSLALVISVFRMSVFSSSLYIKNEDRLTRLTSFAGMRSSYTAVLCCPPVSDAHTLASSEF